MYQTEMSSEVRRFVEKRRTRPDDKLLDDAVSYLNETISHEDDEKFSDPIDYLKKVMKERNLRNKDLKIYIGSSGYVGSVLKRRKPLTLKMIRNLHKYLGIPAEILIQPYDCR